MKRLAITLALVACGGAKPVTSVEIPLPQSKAQSGVYAIRFDHPSRVGERGHWVISADEERITTTRRGADVTSDEHVKKRARLDAIATVMTLDAAGKTSELLIDIADLSYTNGKSERIHKKRGKLMLVYAKHEADAKLTFDGVEPTDEMREAAKLLFTLTNGGPDDDEVMGPPGPQRVGSHWRVDGKRAAEALSEEEGGEMMNGAQISGDAWLEGVGLVAGIECLDVHAVIHIDNLDVAAKLGSGGGAQVARITMNVSTKVPTDTSRSRVADHQLVEATIKISTPSPNGEVTLETSYVARRDGIYEELSPEGGASR